MKRLVSLSTFIAIIASPPEREDNGLEGKRNNRKQQKHQVCETIDKKKRLVIIYKNG